jgi:hypothetical protein
LSVDDRQTALFGLRGIYQHSFHDDLPSRSFFVKELFSSQAQWANDAKEDAVRTWGIAGELLTAQRPTEKSVSRVGSGRRRVDQGSRGQTDVCY